MVSFMGPPPKAFLERTPMCRNYRDVEEHLFGTRETQLEGRDHEMILNYAEDFRLAESPARHLYHIQGFPWLQLEPSLHLAIYIDD
ncbi:unnamed protein product [Clonostachys rhizophaga]|uniref:Uncharacterized protein n=1 Tax=Clonostachys rhizophaga TaxID=160324 RepID=A0A9N9YIS3_9HYPO|nr:unnamed protein product [Clonostachys rhizophaga]